MSSLKPLRFAIAFILVGILFELVVLLDLTPMTFVGFTFIGIPCLGLGVLIYLFYVVRQLKKKDAL